MMKRLSLILALALVAVSLQAQLLWKVSGNGLEKDSYIFGTMHMAPPSMIEQINGLNEALNQCDVLIGEVANSDKSLGTITFSASRDSTLNQVLSPEDYAVVQKEFEDYFGEDIDFEFISQLAPVTLDAMLQYRFSLEVFPDAKMDCIDDGLQVRARAMGIPVVGFELDQEQDDIIEKAFSTKSIKEQAIALVDACREGTYLKKLHDDNIAECRSYLDQKLQCVQGDNEFVSDEGKEIILNNRNHNWIEQLVKMMPERSCLVAVGRAHLRGDQGLLQLLRDRSYTVEPV